MTSPGHKKVSHIEFFWIHEPYHILINVLYIFVRKQLTERAHLVILEGRVRENALLGLHGNGMRNLWKLQNRATMHFTNPTMFSQAIQQNIKLY